MLIYMRRDARRCSEYTQTRLLSPPSWLAVRFMHTPSLSKFYFSISLYCKRSDFLSFVKLTHSHSETHYILYVCPSQNFKRTLNKYHKFHPDPVQFHPSYIYTFCHFIVQKKRLNSFFKRNPIEPLSFFIYFPLVFNKMGGKNSVLFLSF